MEVDRPSSPLSPPEEFHDSISAPTITTNGHDNDEDNAARATSKFSVAALCSPTNSPSVGVRSSLPTTPILGPRSEDFASNGGIEAIPKALPQPNPRTSDGKQGANGNASTPPAKVSQHQTIFRSNEGKAVQIPEVVSETVSDAGSQQGDEDEDGEDNEDDEDGEEEEEEEEEDDDDDDDEEDDEDDEEDDDDEDDDNSTGSRDLDAHEDDVKVRIKRERVVIPNNEVSPATAVDDRQAGGDTQVSAANKTGDPTEQSAIDGEESEGAPASAQASASASASTHPKKRMKRKEREYSVDVALPEAAPALPTVRLPLKISKTNYLFDVPKLLHAELTSKSHPWAAWWEKHGVNGKAGSSTTADVGGPATATSAVADGLGDLGAYAHLLNRYPVDAPSVGQKKRRKRRKANEIEDYDVNDPFVDDSELQIDEPTHSAKPLSKGFYIAMGDVELETLAKKKRKTTGPAVNAALAGSHQAPCDSGSGSAAPTASGSRIEGGPPARPHYLAAGTQLEVSNMLHHLRVVEKNLPITPSMPVSELPITALGLVVSEPPQAVVGTRDSPIEIKEGSASSLVDKKKLYPIKPVDRRLAAEFEYLGRLVAAESFQVKAKFPPNLRQPLRKAAKMALDVGQYNENFFNYLPNIFPYNRFTMSKLCKRDFYETHLKALKELQEDVLDDLKVSVDEALPAHRQEHEQAVKVWRDAVKADGVTEAAGTIALAPVSLNSDDDPPGTVAPSGAIPVTNGIISPAEPARRWKWTERMREDVFRVIVIENGMTELKAEKLKLESSLEQVSELNQRKAAYKRIYELWPEEQDASAGGPWTTSTAISTQFSLQKKKNERQNLALAEQQQQQQQ